MAQTDAVLQPEQPGQVVDGSAPQNQPVGNAQVVPATKDADEVAAAEAIRRIQQSENDKQAALLAKGMKRLREAGFDVKAEQVLQLLSNNLNALSGTIPEPKPAQASSAVTPASMSGPAPLSDEYVVNKAKEIMNAHGVKELAETDPEFKMVNRETKDPYEFLESIKSAAEAYEKRTGNIANPARIPTLAGGAGAHVPSYVNQSATESLNNYFSEFRKNNVK